MAAKFRSLGSTTPPLETTAGPQPAQNGATAQESETMSLIWGTRIGHLDVTTDLDGGYLPGQLRC
jgi:hypothetical protein